MVGLKPGPKPEAISIAQQDPLVLVRNLKYPLVCSAQHEVGLARNEVSFIDIYIYNQCVFVCTLLKK